MKRLKDILRPDQKKSSKRLVEVLDELQDVQFKVQENRNKPGEHILIREDGKIGFATFNSMSFKIGDVIKGVIQQEHDRYFMVEVRSVVEDPSDK